MWTRERTLYLLIFALLLPALLTNLGLMSLIGDEGIRTLVALEMDRSGNYIAPTLHGELYYKKPPLFNWILLGVFKLTGAETEFTARLTTVFFLLIYAATIFHFARKHVSDGVAALTAFALITCGRMLFYDSLLALIDTCFSWAIFLNFMLTYRLFKRQQWWTLMLVTYALTAAAFLLKGLPALVFQAVTLLTLFIWKKEFRRLFHLPHFAGIGLLTLILGAYYGAWSQYGDLWELFGVIFNESSQRTAVNYGWGATFLHLFTFPFELVYHFLPWSLLVLCLFVRGAWQRVRANEFVHYCLLIFFTNLIVYWTSVEVYPRYLLMHVPLFFLVGFYLLNEQSKTRSWAARTLEILFGVLTVGCALGAIGLVFVPLRVYVPFRIEKAVLLVALFGVLTWFYLRWQPQRMLTFVAVLLVFRLAFDWFVLPDRLRHDWGTEVRLSVLHLAKTYANEPLYIYRDSDIKFTNGFYLTTARGEIVPRVYENFDSTGYYIFDPQEYAMERFEVIDDLKLRDEQGWLLVGKLK